LYYTNIKRSTSTKKIISPDSTPYRKAPTSNLIKEVSKRYQRNVIRVLVSPPHPDVPSDITEHNKTESEKKEKVKI